MKKIIITGAQVITQFGTFESGDKLGSEDFAKRKQISIKMAEAFFDHLVISAGAAEYLVNEPYQTKIDDTYLVKKNPQSSPSSQRDKVSQKKTRITHKKKQQ